MGGFTAKPVEGSRLIKMSYVSPSPTLAAQVANSFADNFIKSTIQRRYDASAYARHFLEKQIATVKAGLENSERQLVIYATQQNIINTGGGEAGKGSDTNSLQGSSLIAMNSALSQAQERRIVAEQNYRNAMRAGNTSEVNTSTQQLRQQRAQLESEYQAKLSTFKPDYPEMVRAKANIDALDQEIRKETGTVASGQTNTLLMQFRAAAAAERQLQGQVNSLKSQVLNLRARSIQYNILQREVDTSPRPI